MEGAPGATGSCVAPLPDDPRLYCHSLRRRSYANRGGGRAAAAELTQAPAVESSATDSMFCDQRFDAPDEATRLGGPRGRSSSHANSERRGIHQRQGRRVAKIAILGRARKGSGSFSHLTRPLQKNSWDTKKIHAALDTRH